MSDPGRVLYLPPAPLPGLEAASFNGLARGQVWWPGLYLVAEMKGMVDSGGVMKSNDPPRCAVTSAVVLLSFWAEQCGLNG